jgi:hypothetical protein
MFHFGRKYNGFVLYPFRVAVAGQSQDSRKRSSARTYLDPIDPIRF